MTATLRATALLGLLLTACNGGDEEAIAVTTNEADTFDADWSGEALDANQSITWTNSLGAAEYSLDITAATGGSVDVTVEDADGEVVAVFGREAGVGDDSVDGQTSVGTPGEWTLTIELDDFTGNGSVDLSAANPDDL